MKNKNSVNLDEKDKTIYLYQKYRDIISFMEDFPAPLRESLRNTITKFHDSYDIMKN